MAAGPGGDSSAITPLRALANPVRLRILSLLTATAGSATDVARELGIRHASASYHLRLLERAGMVEVAEVREVHGGRERLYRHSLPADPDSVRSPWNAEDLRLVIEALGVDLRRRVQHSAPGLSAVIDGEYWVPLELWREVRRDIELALRRLHAAARPPGGAGQAHVSASALLFQLLDEPAGEDAAGPGPT